MIKRLMAVVAALALAATGALAASPAQASGHSSCIRPIDRNCGGPDLLLSGLRPLVTKTTGKPKPQLFASAFYYAGGFQNPPSAATSLAANVEIAKPSLDTTNDAHSLGELAVSKDVPAGGGYNQIVEVGYNVDQGVNGDVNPHLFTTTWTNGTFNGYNSGSFVQCNTVGGVNNCGQATDVWDMGDTLTVGSTMVLGITYQSTGSVGWWISARLSTGAAEWLGYWPSTVWTGGSPSVTTFTSAPRIYAFGEVATNSAGVLGCTDMYDGGTVSSTHGAVFGSITAAPNTTAQIDIDANPQANDPTKYDYVPLGTLSNTRTFRYSGPGAC